MEIREWLESNFRTESTINGIRAKGDGYKIVMSDGMITISFRVPRVLERVECKPEDARIVDGKLRVEADGVSLEIVPR